MSGREWLTKKHVLHSLHHTHQQLPLIEQKILDHFYVFWSGIYMISIQQAVLCILLQMYFVLASVILTIVMFPNAKRRKLVRHSELCSWLSCRLGLIIMQKIPCDWFNTQEVGANFSSDNYRKLKNDEKRKKSGLKVRVKKKKKKEKKLCSSQEANPCLTREVSGTF